ncbi:CDP-alcohol phosphatidyltransferase family protein [Agarilytica rhodophyticola]|uniref:CDP-alcohol phosphatidyltransferase family protein n=1 Tax=Agarilytica rhodophyticola TaxID=1737490 RepID=UPI000B342C1D|nr:CDP-alcohol phosphatidyltransferase family protein [Agarilytica rhodophyticola]
MLDAHITPLIDPVIKLMVEKIDRHGITPNQLTVSGFIIGALALPALAMQYWYTALVLILVNRLFDGLDGALARHLNQSSAAGGFLDISLDFLFYSFIPLGFAFADPQQNALCAAILLATFIGTGASFLAFAIPAEKYNIDKPQFAYKSFYYLNGLTEGTETIAFFVAFCIWPQYFHWLSLAFSAAAIVTILTRVTGGYMTLKNIDKE